MHRKYVVPLRVHVCLRPRVFQSAERNGARVCVCAHIKPYRVVIVTTFCELRLCSVADKGNVDRYSVDDDDIFDDIRNYGRRFCLKLFTKLGQENTHASRPVTRSTKGNSKIALHDAQCAPLYTVLRNLSHLERHVLRVEDKPAPFWRSPTIPRSANFDRC